MTLGGYLWQAVLGDGGEVFQFSPVDGQEQSVEILRTAAQPVTEMHLIPKPGTALPYVYVEVGEGQELIKHWTRTFSFNMDTSEQVEAPCIDVVGLLPRGRSRRAVRLYIRQPSDAWPYGLVQLTTSKEPPEHRIFTVSGGTQGEEEAEEGEGGT